MKTAVIIFAFIIIVLFLVCGFIYNQIVWRRTFPIPKFILKMIAGNTEHDDYEEKSKKALREFKKLPIEKVEIKAADGAKLTAHILIPENSNGKLILACHGARSSGLGEFAFEAPYFYEEGYTVVMPDHRGCGESDGKFMGYGTHESRDAFLWLDYAEKRFPDMPVFLFGISMGAATVLMMSENAEDERIRGIIADCGYTSAWNEFSYQIHTSFHLPDFPVLHICNLYSRIFAGYSFKEASPIDAVRKAKKPILFIHGKDDDFVPYYMEKELYNACCSDKYILSIDGAVHARSYYTNPTAYQSAMEKFTEKCLGENK